MKTRKRWYVKHSLGCSGVDWRAREPAQRLMARKAEQHNRQNPIWHWVAIP